MKQPELKPCPFCGAAAEFDTDSGSHGYTSASVRVKCSRYGSPPMPHEPHVVCFARTHAEATEAWVQGLGHYTVEAQAYNMVAEQWNKRT